MCIVNVCWPKVVYFQDPRCLISIEIAAPVTAKNPPIDLYWKNKVVRPTTVDRNKIQELKLSSWMKRIFQKKKKKKIKTAKRPSFFPSRTNNQVHFHLRTCIQTYLVYLFIPIDLHVRVFRLYVFIPTQFHNYNSTYLPTYNYESSMHALGKY